MKRPELALDHHRDDAGVIWLLGADALRQRQKSERSLPPTAQLFAAGGLVTMRDGWAPLQGHATFLCGPHGALSCGHSHADALALELFAGGAPLLVDAGTYAYSGAPRNRYRSTAAHNTVEVAGRGASEPSTAFRWATHADARAIGWVHRPLWSAAQGEHLGYSRLSEGGYHRRTLLHPCEGLWIVCDELKGLGDLGAVVRWHAAPHVSIQSLEESRSSGCMTFAMKQARGSSATLCLLGGGTSVIATDTVAPQYGAEVPALTLEWQLPVERDVRAYSVVIDWVNFAHSCVRLIAEGGGQVTTVNSPTSVSSSNPDSPVLKLHLTDSPMCHEGLTLPAGAFVAIPATARSAEMLVGVGHFLEDKNALRWVEATRLEKGWEMASAPLALEAN